MDEVASHVVVQMHETVPAQVPPYVAVRELQGHSVVLSGQDRHYLSEC